MYHSKGILGVRKKITIYGGVGFRGDAKGIKRRKTVCGHKIHERISQINLKVIKQGTKKLAEIFGAAEAKKEEKGEVKEEKKHEKPREHKAEGLPWFLASLALSVGFRGIIYESFSCRWRRA